MVLSDTLSLIFAAFADPSNRNILPSPVTGGEVAEDFEISALAISKQLKVLEREGQIERTQKPIADLTTCTEPLD